LYTKCPGNQTLCDQMQLFVNSALYKFTTYSADTSKLNRGFVTPRYIAHHYVLHETRTFADQITCSFH